MKKILGWNFMVLLGIGPVVDSIALTIYTTQTN